MNQTDFLFARPSFIEGLARIIDFGGTLNEYNNSINPKEADSRAIRNDFAVVGKDICNAVDEFAHAPK
jgi:hypothetical protein